MPEVLKKPVLEVERKFRVSAAALAELPDKLASFGFKLTGEVFMTDTFLPTPDPGDMLRLRDEETKGVDGHVSRRIVLTAKRWIIFPDGGREREEHEEEVGELTSRSFIGLGKRIAGGDLLSFSKNRVLYEGKLDSFDCVVSLDHTDSLGSFSGDFVEIEVLADTDAELTKIREGIVAFAGRLLGATVEPEQRSYMDMLKLSKN